MYHKVHLRLFLLFSGITSLILCIMTITLLSASEQNLMKTQKLSFQNDINTLSVNLENQTVISYEWLSSLEKNGHYYISILDNGIPFQFQYRNPSEINTNLQTEAWSLYDLTKTSLPLVPQSYKCKYRTFDLTTADNQQFSGCVITIDKEKGILEMMVLCPLDSMYTQIKHQRYFYLSILLITIILICSFSWFFTGKLLMPLEESRKKEAQFIAAASHELRTPLAVILSCMETYESTPEKRDKLFTVLKEETLRMSKLIEDMLTLSRHDNRTLSFTPTKTELDTLLLNSFDAFQPLAKKHHLSMEIQLPEEAITPVLCDGDRISQLIAILLHNAISYSQVTMEKPGSIRLTLSQPSPNHAIISVIDHGPGIPDADKVKIFDRFYRVETSRSTKGHFGLGLSIADEIIKAHHGSIQVLDTPGGGATFQIIL